MKPYLKPYWTNGRATLYQGHVLDVLGEMDAQSVHMVATSPPYWGLRDYGIEGVEWPAVSYSPMAGLAPIEIAGCAEGCAHVWGEERVIEVGRTDGGRDIGGRGGNYQEEGPHQVETSQGQYCQLCGGWRGSLGLEPTIEAFVGHLVLVFRALHRVLRDDGTLWLNLGDSMSKGGGNRNNGSQGATSQVGHTSPESCPDQRVSSNLPAKNLMAIPWRCALALQADGWYLRSEMIWAKGVSFCPTYSGSCMPESVRDRPTKGHEQVFLLSKKKRYFYDVEATKEGCSTNTHSRGPEYHKLNKTQEPGLGIKDNESWSEATWGPVSSRNLRSVWTINPGSYAGAHFATFPPALVEPMIKAGTSAKGVCPECGAGWERVVEKTADIDPSAKGSRFDKGKTGHNGEGRVQEGERFLSQTTGWTPSCSCGTEHPIPQEELDADPTLLDDFEIEPFEPVPATILDPFFGSGTTGDVAIRLGRRAVGIELSKTYCDDHIIPRLSAGIQMELL